MSKVDSLCEACGPGCCTTMLSHIGRLSGAAGLKKSVMLRLGGISTLLNDNRVDNRAHDSCHVPLKFVPTLVVIQKRRKVGRRHDSTCDRLLGV